MSLSVRRKMREAESKAKPATDVATKNDLERDADGAVHRRRAPGRRSRVWRAQRACHVNRVAARVRQRCPDRGRQVHCLALEAFELVVQLERGADVREVRQPRPLKCALRGCTDGGGVGVSTSGGSTRKTFLLSHP